MVTKNFYGFARKTKLQDVISTRAAVLANFPGSCSFLCAHKVIAIHMFQFLIAAAIGEAD